MIRSTLFIALALALLAPAAATAASTKPDVSGAAVANLSFDSVTVTGSVDPNGAATTWFVQYGTTTLYGAQTAEIGVGAGNKPVGVSVPVAGLAPATRYHYRLVARNKHGITKGADHTFKTRAQPLGVSLAATPPAVSPGGPVQLSGTLTGTNNDNRQVVLQSNPWPYAGFATVGNPLVTDANGNFSFAVLSVPVTTQFRVLMPAKPEVTSPIVVVGAAISVFTRTKKVVRHRRSVTVRFRGTIRPAVAGGLVSIQKNRGGIWETVATTRAQFSSITRSRYSKRVRIRHGGQFRVVADSPDAGRFLTGAGRAITIHRR